MGFEFLGDREDERPWTPTAGEEKGQYWVGDGQHALEVVFTTFAKEPSRKKVRELWKDRWNNRPSPVLLVAAWPSGAPERAMLCGPLGDDPSIVVRDVAQAERLARRALAEPSRAFAIQFITAALAEVDDALPGVRNEGLLSSHELRVGVPARKDWADASTRATAMLGRSDRELVRAMGYEIDRKGEIAVLRTADGDEARAVAVFLDRSDRPDAPSVKFDHRTPVDMALLHARREGLRWVLAVRGSTLRLYSALTSGAAGQRGRTETFLELDLALLETQHAGYLTLLFAADALAAGGTFDEVASASRDFTTQLSERLRDQVYEHTVPRLAAAIAARHEGVPDKEALDGIYHAALTILFRLLFLAYAEDRRLLPYDTSDAYRAASLKAIAHELTAAKNDGQPLGFDDPFTGVLDVQSADSSELWSRCRTLFKAVEKGHTRWGIPPYGGGLFTKGSAAGKLLDDLELTDVEFGPALMALIVDRSSDGGVGPIDFRSLSVREFGSIYEGLLENDLAVAGQDLALKKDTKLKAQVYVPASTGDNVTVAKGSIYLHNSSGARKSSGSYFTPAFAVDHLIGTALTPTLDEHLVRVEALIDAGDEVGAAELLLDFRVTDISMGSGHFLTAAVDAIEAGITDLLARRPLPHFRKELERLRASARSALGEAADSYEIEDSQLVRRLIARKCIYGVDLNHISVELARVSIWIHTFVPGLPLSFLDRTLIVGDSLTGIATVQEAVDALTSSGAQAGLFDDPIREALKAAEEPLRRLATISDATLDEVAEAKEATATALAAVKPVQDVFDLIVANRLGEVGLPLELNVARLPRIETALANDVAKRLKVVHFPIAFPEVFLRKRSGFDVVLGNPPWEKPQLREDDYWSRFIPGFRSLSSRERTHAVARTRSERPDLAEAFGRELAEAGALQRLVHSGNWGLGAGHVDLAKLFAIRVWRVLGSAGAFGLVLPRGTVFAGPGLSLWRRQVLDSGSFVEVCTLLNDRGWIFPDVASGYAVCFVTASRVHGEATRLTGPLSGASSYLKRGNKSSTVRASDLVSWSSDVTFPNLTTPEGFEVYKLLAACKRFREYSDIGFRAVQGDINAATQKNLYVDSSESTTLPVYSGSSFQNLVSDTGNYYAYVNEDQITNFLQERRYAQARNRRSAFFGLATSALEDPSTLPMRRPRIIWRNVTSVRTRRSLVVALAPPNVVLSHGAQYLLRTSAEPRDEAFLLGVLGSSIADWWIKQTVELNVVFSIFVDIPIPELAQTSELHQQIASLGAELASRDSRLNRWRASCELPTVASESKDHVVAMAKLDALVAHAFGLQERHLQIVYASLGSGWLPGELSEFAACVIEHFRDIAS